MTSNDLAPSPSILPTSIPTPTIVARLTADVSAAIATIGIHGPDAISLVQRFVTSIQRNTDRFEVGRVHLVGWNSPDLQGNEQLVLCRIDDNTVELHCHGGPAITRRILHDLGAAGAKIVSANAWQAAVSPRDSAIAVSAQQQLIHSTTPRTASILLDQWNGALESSLRALLDDMTSGRTDVASDRLQLLLDRSPIGLHLIQPWRVVLAGPPNVGKSSLMNALSGQRKAIVHHQPGTTRDWLEVEAQIDGWPIVLTDTAGIRRTEDEIEMEGVARARQQINRADLVLLVIDAVIGWTTLHAELLDLLKMGAQPIAIVINKIDLGDLQLQQTLQAQLDQIGRGLPSITTSCTKQDGIQALVDLIAQLLVQTQLCPGDAIPFTTEQVKHLKLAQQALHSFDHPTAISQIQALLA